MKNQIICMLVAFQLFSHSSCGQEVEKKKQEIPYKLVNLYFSVGPALPISGNMWESFEEYPYEGFSLGSVGGIPERHNKSTNLNTGLELTVHEKFKFGFWLLPGAHKCFEGAIGKNGPALFVFSAIYTGSHVKEELFSKPFMFNFNSVIFRYNAPRFPGIEISGGVGLLVNNFEARTSLWVFDTSQVNDGSGYFHTVQESRHQDYIEKKTCLGAVAILKMNVFLGRRFSIFGQLIAGGGSPINISEKTITVKREMAHVPAHQEQLKGVGASAGIGFHFISKRRSEENKNPSRN